MRAEHDLRLKVSHAFRHRGPFPYEAVLRRVADLARQLRSAVVIRLSAPLDHWTALKAVTVRSLVLFDSSGYARFNRTRCLTNAAKRCDTGKIRRAGFHNCIESEVALARRFKQLQEHRLIP